MPPLCSSDGADSAASRSSSAVVHACFSSAGPLLLLLLLPLRAVECAARGSTGGRQGQCKVQIARRCRNAQSGSPHGRSRGLLASARQVSLVAAHARDAPCRHALGLGCLCSDDRQRAEPFQRDVCVLGGFGSGVSLGSNASPRSPPRGTIETRQREALEIDNALAVAAVTARGRADFAARHGCRCTFVACGACLLLLPLQQTALLCNYWSREPAPVRCRAPRESRSSSRRALTCCPLPRCPPPCPSQHGSTTTLLQPFSCAFQPRQVFAP